MQCNKIISDFKKNGGIILKKIKFGFALATLALFGASSLFANKITLTNNADSSSNEYESIQKALDAIPAEGGDYTISLEPGTYEEVLFYRGAASIKLSGQSTEKYGADVVISEANDGDLWKQKRAANQQNGRCIFEFEGTGNLALENLTMENTFKRASMKGSNTQAETIGFDSTGTLAAYNCAFKSHQDTLRMTGKSWFYKCYVEGDTDFIWMEARGVVALFEECEIRALYDEKPSTASIIGAPRMNCNTRIGKGLVIYNSKVSSEQEGMTALARTPWNSGYYNQVAYINTAIPDVSTDLWQGKPLTAEGIARTTIGWKLDSKSFSYIEAILKEDAELLAKSSGKAPAKKDGPLFTFNNQKFWYTDPLASGRVEFGTSSGAGSKSFAAGRDDILSAKETSEEYSGRRGILNRYFDIARNGYRKDYLTNWEIDNLIAKNGWKVTADSSKELVSENAVSVKVYDFAKDISSYADLTVDGFTNNPPATANEIPSIVGEAGSTISFDVADKTAVIVYGLNKGDATIQSTKQGAAKLNFNNNSKTLEIEKEYLVYEKGGKVTIKANDQTYITKIVVEPDSKIKFIPVTKIAVTAKNDVTEIESRRKLPLSAKLTPALPTNSDIDWSVSDSSIATISSDGVLKTLAAAEDTMLVVKATSKDAKGVSGEYKILVHKVDPNAFTATWFDSIEASIAPFAGNSDNEDVATVTNAYPSGKGKLWVNNTSKYNSSFSDGGITYTKYPNAITDKETAYVEFPIYAKKDLKLNNIIISYGNHGTSNVASLVTITKGKETKELFSDTSRKARSVKVTYELDEEVKAGETATIRIALYGYNGSDTEIAAGKAPTIGTVQILGKAE